MADRPELGETAPSKEGTQVESSALAVAQGQLARGATASCCRHRLPLPLRPPGWREVPGLSFPARP